MQVIINIWILLFCGFWLAGSLAPDGGQASKAGFSGANAPIVRQAITEASPEKVQDQSVYDIMRSLGASASPHLPKEIGDAALGEAIFHKGFAKNPDQKGSGKRQSAHFVCSSCHNTVKEDPDLKVADAEARLEYAIQNNLPFLQGSTLYGVVNRTSYYNGDYEKKYGELVEAARNDLRGAIQLCATECAQGRSLEDWEMESILAYLWTLELRLDDLGLSNGEQAKLKEAIGARNKDLKTIDWLKSFYLQGSPANFGTPPPDRREGYTNLVGRPDKGKAIYQLSCLHCHENKRYAMFPLDDSQMSLRHLARHVDRYGYASLYQVMRYGVQPLYGRRAYMPQYTMEKMSDQMIEDLRAYVEQGTP